MEPITYDAGLCPVYKTLELVSGKWKPLILYLIEQGANRFSSLKKRMPTLSKKVLTAHLRELEADGLITREVVTLKAPQVVVYHLTRSGESLRRLIEQIFNWGTECLRVESVRRNDG